MYASNMDASEQKLAYDLYLRNLFALDFEIILATFRSIGKVVDDKSFNYWGAGYIGSHTTLVLLEAGFDVVVIDNFSNSSKIALDRVANLSGKKLINIDGDITDRLTVRNIFEQQSDISAVIHLLP